MAATPINTVTDATGGLAADLLDVGAVGLGIGVAVWTLSYAWRFIRSFVY